MMQDGLLQSSAGAVDAGHQSPLGRIVVSASIGVSRKHGCLLSLSLSLARSLSLSLSLSL